MDRRIFVRNVSGAIGAVGIGSLIPACGNSSNPGPTTIQDAIDLVIRSLPGGRLSKTVDTVKSGDASRPLTGVITTMFATIDLIRYAIESKANLIIAHEPSFYNHLDDTSGLQKNDTYLYKKDLLEKHGIVIWRCHDYIHAFKPDGVYEGVLEKLGWKSYSQEDQPWNIIAPPISLGSVIKLVKEKLNIPYIRYVGDPSQVCKKILLMVGAAGGTRQINAINDTKPDLVLIGELVEWETLEYMRDLRSSGSPTALIVLGHIPSEEPGMEWLAAWLKPKLANIPVTHVGAGNALGWA